MVLWTQDCFAERSTFFCSVQTSKRATDTSRQTTYHIVAGLYIFDDAAVARALALLEPAAMLEPESRLIASYNSHLPAKKLHANILLDKSETLGEQQQQQE